MPRILVVDDESSIRLLYKEEMQDEGYEVDTASSGLEAIEKIRASRPDLVTLDIKMVGMDGLEALAKIREFDLELPIILCTAYGSYRQDFGTWGSDVYVTKSANLEELKREVKRLLSAAGKI
jgi:two-component system, response regulator, stage 0 sporulation protein F